jgi:hypothetical protein
VTGLYFWNWDVRVLQALTYDVRNLNNIRRTVHSPARHTCRLTGRQTDGVKKEVFLFRFAENLWIREILETIYSLHNSFIYYVYEKIKYHVLDARPCFSLIM